MVKKSITLWPIYVIVLFSLMAFGLQFGFIKIPFYINVTHSLPYGIYKIVPLDNLEHGDYVIIDMPEDIKALISDRSWSPPDGTPLLKRVYGLPGDEFHVTDSEISINGKYFGRVKVQDNKGLPMPNKVRGIQHIAEGYILPLSDYSPRSFDGRYFGAIPIENIKSKVVPFLTFK